MLALKIENTALDMPAGQRLRVVMSCPLFDRDRIVRTFSQPFTLPLSPRNRRVLRHVDRFDASEAWGERECQLWLGGGQYERGELVSLGSDDEGIEVVFRNLPLTLMDDLKQVYINEILEDIAVPYVADPSIISLESVVSEPLYVIVIGGNTYTSIETGPLDIANDMVDQINADFPGMAAVSSSGARVDLQSEMLSEVGADWSLLVAFTFYSYVNFGEANQFNFVSHVEGVVATPVDTHCFPLLHWAGFYDGKNAETTNFVNPVLDGSGLLNEYVDAETDWLYSYMPAVRVPYIIERIRNAAGIGYVAGYFNDNADAGAMIMVSDRTNDKAYHDFLQSNEYQYINGFEQTIVLNKHVPKMTALDFLQKLANGLNLIIDYKDGGLHFTKALDLVSLPPVNWSQYVNPARYNRAITKPEGVLLSYPLDEAEAYVPIPQLQAYELGAAGVRVEMSFSSLYMATRPMPDHGTLRCPHTTRKGKCPAYGQDLATMATYFLFYRGVGVSSLPEDYEYATHDELDTDASTVIGGLSLELDGTYGLVAQNYGATLGYGDLSEMEITAIVPESEIYRLKKWDNARVHFYHPNGPVTMAIRSVEFEMSAGMDSGWVEARVRGVIE